MNGTLHLTDLRRINIHHDLDGVAGHAFVGISGHRHVKARAYDQEEIAVLQGEVGSARRQRAGAAKVQGMRIRNEIEAEPCGENWNTSDLNHIQKEAVCSGRFECRSQPAGRGVWRD